MRIRVNYNPEIHTKLCDALNVEVEKSKKYVTGGVSQHTIFKKREINIAGKTIDLTKTLRNKVDSLSQHRFGYVVNSVGDITITFESINDRLPSIIRKPAEKMMLAKVKAELKKDFGKNILNIKQEG